jgi:CRISPR/Cas system endoribonuclease Cas6 (RAMP superfamily)
VEPLDADTSVHGIYVTLNEVNPALLSRRSNRIKIRLGKKDSTTSDADILRRRWLPIDIDPLRPSGVSSTDEEHTLALTKAEEIACWISGLGFPEPIRADSGNGAHLLFRIELPNDDAATALVKGCLATLDALFSDERVSVDTANYNAARIWKLYGTVSRKGDNTPERPHRRSRIISAPDLLQIVKVEQLRELIARLPTEALAQAFVPVETKGYKNIFNLPDWLREHEIAVKSEKPYANGHLYILDQCPFSSAHKDGAFAIKFGNGAVFAGCKHASCGGGSQRWQELRDRYEPDRAEKRKDWEQKQQGWRKDRVKAKAESNGTKGPTSETANPDAQAAALDVLEHGDPAVLMLTTFAQEHVGDEILARCMILSMASQAVKNSDGLHVSVTGDSGKGKTHAFKKMMRQVPDQYKVKGTVSNKALYYMKDLKPRTVLMSDDTELSDGIQEILKSATSNFHEPITHTTVTKDLTSRVCTIPERCVWWIAKKEGTGDDQVMNRMLTCWIDESSGQDARVLAAKQAREMLDPDSFVDETAELRTCRVIWEILHEQTIWVIIPYSKRIRFNAICNRRNPDMLYDLIKSHAALFFMQRQQKTSDDGTLCVYADEADFAAANDVFTLLNDTAGGQESKMTKKESDLLGLIHRSDRSEFTIQDLQELTGWPYINIYRALKGYDSRGKNYTGLLEKCPAISFTDRTVTVSDEDGVSIRRRTDAFAWSRELYKHWTFGGACWLDQDPDGGNDDDADGSFTALQHVDSTITATAEKQNGALSVSGFPEYTVNNNNSVLKEGNLQQNENATIQAEPGLQSTQCLHDFQSAVNEKRSPQISVQSDNKISEHTPISYSTCSKLPELKPDLHPSVVNKDKPRAIRAGDYKKLEPPEPKTACYACGKKGSWYAEKFTAERRARPKDQQTARRICRSCYNETMKAEQRASVPLPGTIDVSRCTRVTAEVGKCSVCGLERSGWIDRTTHVLLCEHCYGREVRGHAHA